MDDLKEIIELINKHHCKACDKYGESDYEERLSSEEIADIIVKKSNNDLRCSNIMTGKQLKEHSDG